jgi:protein-S-isoprenylcysteine O-methyltransferase Ste14
MDYAGAMTEPRQYNKALGASRRLAALLLVVSLLLLSRPTPASVIAGSFFVILGESLRIWAAGYLHKTVDLVTSGPYRYTRNPLYLGRLLIFTGLAVMATLPYRANLGVLAAGYVVFFAYYLPRKERVEPERLRRVHGERYETYHRSVPALVPTVRPYAAASSAGWSSERMRRNRELWMVVGLAAATLLLLWMAYERPEGLLSWTVARGIE